MSKSTMHPNKLRNFSKKVAEIYKTGKIRGPIHLSGGSEKRICSLFKEYFHKGDWIFSTYRCHYHWLLSGRPEAKLLEQIRSGHSMSVFDDKFFTSSIVAGCAPIAAGVAYALKLKNSKEKVLCFLGDMAAETGLAHESIHFASGHDLPIMYICEDNGYAVTTKTREVWGMKNSHVYEQYSYERKYPHAGVGKFVLF